MRNHVFCPVDIVIAEGFRRALIATVEIFVRARHGEPRCYRDPNIVVVVSDGGPVRHGIAFRREAGTQLDYNGKYPGALLSVLW